MPGAGRRFQKGTSGNPSGRPKSDRTIAEMAREHCPKAIQTLVEIMCDRKVTPAARVSAAGHLIDRGYGRPPQTNTLIAATPRSAANLSDDELASIVFGAQPAPSVPVEPEAEQPHRRVGT